MKIYESKDIHQIIDALSYIDDDLLAQADNFSVSHNSSAAKRKRHISKILASAAAVFATAGILGVFIITKYNAPRHTPQTIESNVEESLSCAESTVYVSEEEVTEQVTCIGVRAADDCTDAIEYFKSVSSELREAVDDFASDDPNGGAYTIMEPFVAERETSAGITDTEASTFPVVRDGKVVCVINIFEGTNGLSYAVSNGLCSELNSLLNNSEPAVLRYCFDSGGNFIEIKIIYDENPENAYPTAHPLRALLTL